MKKSEFYYDLPEKLIAQHPCERRDHSRLMVIDRQSGEIADRKFCELGELLRPGDCLILNDSRVLPARLFGAKEGGGAVNEFLLLSQLEPCVWEAITKPGKRAKAGSRFLFGEGLMTGEVLEVKPDGNRVLRFAKEAGELAPGEFFALLDRIGQMPLPPYITEKLDDNERYQTVYSREVGSAAAPTAGLHFTLDMLDALRAKGISTGYVTLHVGLGTFRPVKTEDISDHTMHSEHYVLPEATARLINETKATGGRVVCVGTTSCRTLESCGRAGLPLKAQDGWTDIFIYPGYKFTVMDALITNFHLPESTLIMLVAAFAGYDLTMEAYRRAVGKEYRFFSFGDAMFIR